MARELGGVGENAMVADDAVVRDVDVVHHQHVVADARHHPAALGAAMNGGELANPIIVADLQARRLAVILEILRRGADRGELEDLVARADRGVALYHRIGTDFGVGADPHFGTDDRARSDFDAGIEFGAPIDDGGWMDAPGYGSCSSTSIADNFGLGRELAVHPRLGMHLPQRAMMLEQPHFHPQLIAGNHRAAKTQPFRRRSA